jgi:hypothetical protein
MLTPKAAGPLSPGAAKALRDCLGPPVETREAYRRLVLPGPSRGGGLGQDRRVEVPQISEPLLLRQAIAVYEVPEEGGAIPIELLGHRGEFPAPRSLEPFAIAIVGERR